MAADELRRLLPPVRYPARPDQAKLAARLDRQGFTSHQIALLQEVCNVCAPRGRLRGLGLAVLQLSRLFPEETRFRQEWLPAVRLWFTRDSAARASFALPPYLTSAPLTAFLVSVAPDLPNELAVAIFCRMQDLLADHGQAERSCYTLCLSARHLVAQQRTNVEVAQRLVRRDWLGAIAAMAPPRVHRPGVLDSYQAALRNAIGDRKPAAPRPHASDRRAGGRSEHRLVTARPVTQSVPSLRERLELVKHQRGDGEEAPDVADDLPEDAAASGPSGLRRPTGLQANIALGTPRGLGDLDPLKMQRLLDRLAASDLDPPAQWVLKVSLLTLYCTGWPAGILTALAEGDSVRYDAAAGAVQIPGERVCPWPELAGRTFRLRLHDQLVRLFNSLTRGGLFRLPQGHEVTSAHVSAALRVLCADDAVTVTQSMLRGAVWWAGRRAGWTPERLMLCTCTSDPAFRNDAHYLSLADEVDARPLQSLMLASLAGAERRWHSRGPRRATAGV